MIPWNVMDSIPFHMEYNDSMWNTMDSIPFHLDSSGILIWNFNIP